MSGPTISVILGWRRPLTTMTDPWRNVRQLRGSRLPKVTRMLFIMAARAERGMDEIDILTGRLWCSNVKAGTHPHG